MIVWLMEKRGFWMKDRVWRCFQRDYNSSNTTFSIGFLDSRLLLENDQVLMPDGESHVSNEDQNRFQMV
jgi:hypothetical protein